MPTAVGVAFQSVGRSYFFDPGEFDVNLGDQVVVETSQGLALGLVRIGPREIASEDIESPLKPILRFASEEDLRRHEANVAKVPRALSVCAQKIAELELSMKLVSAEYDFDGIIVTFAFVSERRIDFRALVKDVATALHCRVMFYQIGTRDHAKSLGGYGICGLPLCCASFLNEFTSISMKMAKDQNLFLNPIKFSGLCAKLMCCLEYEHEVYKDGRILLPPIGGYVNTPKGFGRVIDLDILKSSFYVILDEGDAREVYTSEECEWEGKELAKGTCGCAKKKGHCGMARKPCKSQDEEEMVEDA
ncbi:MAG: regulatory iron-sulfur-containing complex subunit RicT [bacterium]|jgi:cell fate regulator YaaT (PSP1 superfamily)